MQTNSKIIISDTSCLIVLSKIDELELLNLMSKEVYVTSAIQKEFEKKLPSWIHIKDPKDIH